MNSTIGASRQELCDVASRLISSIAADHRKVEGTYSARRVIVITLKLDKPRRWWHLGHSRYYVNTSGINVGDRAGSVILYDGSLAKAHWKESVAAYNGKVTRYLEHYDNTTLVWYDDDELRAIIEKLTPVTDM